MLLVEAARHVDEGVLGLERVSGGERDRADARSLPRSAEVGLRADPEDPDATDVALEQRIHGLRRRERDEGDAAAVLAELCEEVAQRVDDTVRHAFPPRARSGRRRAQAAGAALVSTATAFVKVPPTSTPILIARLTRGPPRAARLRHGRIPKTQAVPRM